jgi:hypothetical protein
MWASSPRAFILNKAWLLGLATREPLKKSSELDQAHAVATLVQDPMPHLPFEFHSIYGI